jgi:putative ABC transport system permease protein
MVPALGTNGGFLSVGLGTATVVLVAVAQHWTVVMEPAVVPPAPLLGSIIGLLPGVYPAARAALLEPDRAIRG